MKRVEFVDAKPVCQLVCDLVSDVVDSVGDVALKAISGSRNTSTRAAEDAQLVAKSIIACWGGLVAVVVQIDQIFSQRRCIELR